MAECGACRPRDPCEKHFGQAVFDLARRCGWRVVRFPTWRSTATTPGFPDLLLLRATEILFVELKREKGSVAQVQREWIDALDRVAQTAEGAVHVFLWRPSQWEFIEAALR